ncbi:hypothetical protein RDWZM_003911 [Blomia tropicalis]|uniref:BOS complex subunit TMEM147 n=1 Tax=Blomia tropicalis TaxID=40697 RepID=A0A9Q0RT13_BLOTA|nr:hypothetical protein BLOT_002403 [Blomia tropicalis]KAJ6225366.1 hypothetical protein RDWZM_003911 [Blomia tropicalis]
MTFYHFVNCVLLTFGPPLILYKFSVLSEYGTLWKPLIGTGCYMITQGVKMLIIAGLINLSPLWDHLTDCIGMYYFLVHQQKASVASVKILSLALGWSVTESIFTRFVNFYLNARSMQFSWQYLLTAGEANLSLIQNICLCALLWSWGRRSNKIHLSVIVLYILSISFVESIIVKSISLGALAITTTFLYN